MERRRELETMRVGRTVSRTTRTGWKGAAKALMLMTGRGRERARSWRGSRRGKGGEHARKDAGETERTRRKKGARGPAKATCVL